MPGYENIGLLLAQNRKGHTLPQQLYVGQEAFELDGALLGARNMPEGFDKAGYGLTPVAVENIGGLVFICMAENPPPIDRVRQDLSEQIGNYDLERCKIAAQDDFIEDANWKLVMENNRECYHCDGNHPELVSVLGNNGFGKGLAEDGDGDTQYQTLVESKRQEWKVLGIDHDLIEFPDKSWHRIARLPLMRDAVSQSISGNVISNKLLGPFREPETSSLSVWTEPNSWHHFCCDQVVTFSVTPIAPDKTLLQTSWLVHQDAVEGVDYQLADLTSVWRATNAQDAYLTAINHRGIQTAGYRQGPYSKEEKLVEHFKEFYVEQAELALTACGR